MTFLQSLNICKLTTCNLLKITKVNVCTCIQESFHELILRIEWKKAEHFIVSYLHCILISLNLISHMSCLFCCHRVLFSEYAVHSHYFTTLYEIQWVLSSARTWVDSSWTFSYDILWSLQSLFFFWSCTNRLWREGRSCFRDIAHVIPFILVLE